MKQAIDHIHDIRRELDGDGDGFGYVYVCAEYDSDCPGFDEQDIVATFDTYIEGEFDHGE